MRLNSSVVLLAVLTVGIFEVQAKQLYKWVDADGQTHYGETLPGENVDHVAFEFTDNYQAPDTQDDYYSVQNQLKRLQERRAQARAEKQQAIKAEKQREPEIVYVQSKEPERRYYVPAYYPNYKAHHYNNNYYQPRYPKRYEQKPPKDKTRLRLSLPR